MSLFARTLPASRAAGTLLAAAAAVTTIVLFGPQILGIVAHATPHGPDVALFMAQPAVIKIHILAAVAGVGLGATILSLRKGNGPHRALGWTWVLLMGAAAASSLFIVGLNGDHWSPIHLLSGWTLIILPFAIRAARKHDVMSHRRAMTSLFWGASIVAGAFTFLPGRLMWDLFMG
ncbi:MAG: DUF2306 domain-containing protein [Caulobacter sp.]|nr:DUF2306 domain-containing protein [Caulobacter sp.]